MHYVPRKTTAMKNNPFTLACCRNLSRQFTWSFVYPHLLHTPSCLYTLNSVLQLIYPTKFFFIRYFNCRTLFNLINIIFRKLCSSLFSNKNCCDNAINMFFSGSRMEMDSNWFNGLNFWFICAVYSLIN